MEFGLFLMPSHPPERSLAEGHKWDLRMLKWADEYGFAEAWIGEHHTAVWEPNPAPDLLIAQALMQTKRIRLGPGGFILSYHHPVELAHRISFLDHISGGRFNLGIAAGALPTDQKMFGTSNEINRAMLRESLEIMLRLWTSKEPFEHQGQFFRACLPERHGEHYAHLRPLQQPHPPIGMAGAFSVKSESLGLCGEHGFIPISLNMASRFTAQHWASVEAGARKSGRKASRSDWRIVREVFVAETDQEAWRYTVNGAMGRMFREYFLPLMSRIRTDRVAIEYFVANAADTVADITVEYCARNNWLIGSPETVVRKIEQTYDELGGFGTLIMHAFDYLEDPEPWRRNLELIGKEVKPRVRHLTGKMLESSAARARA
jgi:alkanesulfonate monooxygenase SsuD/methylene tetrahydromethanopterin reductase-like flavin-dependent oxidoreductase (luciferase family)